MYNIVVHAHVVMREPRNRDNGASDVWALTAYYAWFSLGHAVFESNMKSMCTWKSDIPMSSAGEIDVRWLPFIALVAG